MHSVKDMVVVEPLDVSEGSVHFGYKLVTPHSSFARALSEPKPNKADRVLRAIISTGEQSAVTTPCHRPSVHKSIREYYISPEAPAITLAVDGDIGQMATVLSNFGLQQP